MRRATEVEHGGKVLGVLVTDGPLVLAEITVSYMVSYGLPWPARHVAAWFGEGRPLTQLPGALVLDGHGSSCLLCADVVDDARMIRCRAVVVSTQGHATELGVLTWTGRALPQLANVRAGVTYDLPAGVDEWRAALLWSTGLLHPSADGSPAGGGPGGLTGAAAGGRPPEARPLAAGQAIPGAVHHECPERNADGEPPGPVGDSTGPFCVDTALVELFGAIGATGPFCVWCGGPMQAGRRGQRRLTCSDSCRQARRRALRGDVVIVACESACEGDDAPAECKARCGAILGGP